MEISITKLAEYAKRYCAKIPEGTIKGPSSSVIPSELTQFLKFVNKEAEKDQLANRDFYAVEVNSLVSFNDIDVIDGKLAIDKKIIAYDRGTAIKKATRFGGKAKKITGKIDKKKYYIML